MTWSCLHWMKFLNSSWTFSVQNPNDIYMRDSDNIKQLKFANLDQAVRPHETFPRARSAA